MDLDVAASRGAVIEGDDRTAEIGAVAVTPLAAIHDVDHLAVGGPAAVG